MRRIEASILPVIPVIPPLFPFFPLLKPPVNPLLNLSGLLILVIPGYSCYFCVIHRYSPLFPVYTGFAIGYSPLFLGYSGLFLVIPELKPLKPPL